MPYYERTLSWFNGDPRRFNDDYHYESEVKEKCCDCSWRKCLKWSLISIFGLLFFLFILIWVIFPIVFMCDISIQRFLIFPNFEQPSNPEYNNFSKYNTTGVRNLYVNVNDTNKILSLGVWHLLPESLKDKPSKNANFSFDEALKSTTQDVIIYCHGNSGNRIFGLPMYEKLRQFFHVIAVDYRSFGDSSKAELSEGGVVNDLVQFYQWVRTKTEAKIYVWGHSLGSSLGTHMVAKLSEMDIMPNGLALEAPFTTMREEIPVHPLGKIFSWLAYFDVTIANPLQENGFLFRTTTYILNVTCPVMILHAEDDNIIPYTLGEKLYEVTKSSSNLQISPDLVTFHLVSAEYNLRHMGLSRAPKILEYIKSWKDTCEKYNLGKG